MIVFRYISKYPWTYFLGFLLLIVVNLLSAYIPQQIRSAINVLDRSRGLISTELDTLINHTVLIVLLLALLMAIIRTTSRWLLFGLARQIEYDLKCDIFEHLLKFEPKFFVKHQAGDLISLMSNDVQSIRGMAGFAILNILNTAIAFVIIVPLMFDLNQTLTLWFLLLVPLVLLAVTLVSEKIKKYQDLVQDKLAEISRFIEQNLSAIHIIKAYAQERSELQRFNHENQTLLGFYLKLIKARAFVGPCMKVIASAGFILLLYFGAKSVFAKTFTIGDFAAYSLYIERLIWPIATMGWLVTVIYRAKVSGERIENLLAQEPEIKDSADAVDIRSVSKGISLPYLASAQSLKPSYPFIRAASMTAIVGTIGSGKSTLARKLMRLENSNSGEIFVDDLDITKISLESLRSEFSIVPQDSFLFSASIRENILYSLEDNIESKHNYSPSLIAFDDDSARALCVELTKAVAINAEIEALTDAYETLVGERGITLSGGQRQRIAIARALARRPDVLILDDALSSVDSDTAETIVANIKRLRRGLTTVFITHKISLAAEMDEILVLDKGSVIESGSHSELLALKGIYRDLYLRSNGS